MVLTIIKAIPATAIIAVTACATAPASPCASAPPPPPSWIGSPRGYDAVVDRLSAAANASGLENQALARETAAFRARAGLEKVAALVAEHLFPIPEAGADAVVDTDAFIAVRRRVVEACNAAAAISGEWSDGRTAHALATCPVASVLSAVGEGADIEAVRAALRAAAAPDR